MGSFGVVVTRAGIRRVGGDPDKTLPEGWDRLDGKTGAPVGIDKGWDYAPGASVADDIKALNGKLPRLPAQIGARLFERNLVQNVGDLNAQFAEFVDEALTTYVQQRVMIIGALKPKWVDAAAKRGVRVESAEIAVADKAVQHTFRGTPHVKVSSTRQRDRLAKVNPLDLDWYKALPGHLRDPRAVLLDPTQKEPVFLLIYDVPGSQAKLVVEVYTYLAKTKDVLNTVQSGRMIHQADILNDIRRGVVVIEGEV